MNQHTSESNAAPHPGGANLYADQQQRHAAPDLDANAPLLRSNDLQRLNRKALVFLAGIVALLLIAAVWMFSHAGSNSDRTAHAREEQVVIPELPRVADASANATPIPLAPTATSDPMAQLPPLPNPGSTSLDPAYSNQYPTTPPPHRPSLLERRISLAESGTAGADSNALGLPGGVVGGPGMVGPGSAGSGNPQGATAGSSDASSAQFINNSDALLVRGTYIRCVLETRIITDIPGFTSCIVTEPIYSINGRRLLLPKGSKVSGRYDTDANGPRVAVIWDRITTPNGFDVNMSSPGVDNLGGAGHPGDYNAHWASRMSSALMISLVSDAFKYAGAKYGPTTTSVSNGIVTQSPFESNTAQTVERLANQALDRSITRPATVTINQGTVVNVYVARDVDFSGVLSR
jgi:type IV secretion system protein VirB10